MAAAVCAVEKMPKARLYLGVLCGFLLNKMWCGGRIRKNALGHTENVKSVLTSCKVFGIMN